MLSPPDQAITRFAPSPTGYLHLGHAASAWHVWTEAAKLGAQVLLRIEDIDTTRCRPDFTDAIFEDLAWLGFRWPEPVRIQSEHFTDYARVVDDLALRGLAYRCFRTRKEVDDLIVDGDAFIGAPLSSAEESAKIEAAVPFAWRLNLSEAQAQLADVWNELSYDELTPKGRVTHRAIPQQHGDIVIARKDSPSAYHLAATHDDALQGVTHIVRGRDLEDAPHIQVLLQTLMGWPPVTYVHHDLIVGADGKRLSKSNKSASLRQLRENGTRPAEIWRKLELK